MAKKKSATIWAEGGWAVIHTPFDRQFIDALKNAIPRDYRVWDQGGKVWKVDINYLEDLIAVAEIFFEVSLVQEEEPQARQLSPGSGQDSPYHDLFQSLPTEALIRAYKAAIPHIHPDRGGSEEIMKKVNVAWDRIKKERGI